jgi:hypothetical protein
MKNIFATLTNIQKQFVAIFIALALTCTAGSLYYLKSTNNLQNLTLNNLALETNNNPGNSDVNNAVNDIQSKLNQADPEKLIFEEVNLADLKIYPPQWIANRFTKEQQANSLISGPDADADGDGIPNRLELINGSNPLSKYSLCGDALIAKPGCDKTDKQMLEAGLNPLTGLKLEDDSRFNIKKVDKNIIPSIQESFANAETEGVTYTELYEKSRTINLSQEFKDTKITSIKTDRNAILKYLDARFESLKTAEENDEILTFSNIYKLVDINKITELENYYKEIQSKLNPLPTPNIYTNFQKGSVMLVKKILRIIELRKENILSADTNSVEFKEKNKQAALELFWTYRRINDEQRLIESIISNGNAIIAENESNLQLEQSAQ